MQEDVAAGYDAIAPAYAAKVADELQHKPFDRDFLTQFADRLPAGPVLDLGCGPGHVGAFLVAAGCGITGVDLSPCMVAVARQRYPLLHFERGNQCALAFPSASFAGVLSFYSIIHLNPAELALAFDEMQRVLLPGGLLALAFHVGDEVRHVDALFGVATALDFRFLQPSAVGAALDRAGLTVLHSTTRPPYGLQVEAQTERCYLLAVRREGAL